MSRAKNTTGAKDFCTFLRAYTEDLDPSRLRDDVDTLAERHKVLLHDILDETVQLRECNLPNLR